MRYSRLALFLRNPSKYQLQRDETGWSCNSVQATDRGDRFILVRAGRVNLGIVSFGWILSSPSTHPDATYGNAKTTFADIQPLTIVDLIAVNTERRQIEAAEVKLNTEQYSKTKVDGKVQLFLEANRWFEKFKVKSRFLSLKDM